jgi:hypothetical protein
LLLALQKAWTDPELAAWTSRSAHLGVLGNREAMEAAGARATRSAPYRFEVLPSAEISREL